MTVEDQLKTVNRLKAIELVFKIIDIQSNPKITSTHIDRNIQKFIVDLATNSDVPIETFEEDFKK